MNSFNNKIREFMIGRNGPDKLANWALGVALVVTLIGMFIPNIILTVLSYALLIYCFFRIFSRNVSARQRENEKFEDLLSKVIPSNKNRNTKGTGSSTAYKTAAGYSSKKTTSSTTKNKVTFTCDECGQSLSVPKGRGKLKVTCPKCHHQQTIDS